MNTRLHATLLLAFISAFVSGCTDENADRSITDFVTIPDEAAVEATQQRLLSRPKFDLSKVSVARLEIDGHPVEVTSLVPASFRGYEPIERGFRHQDGRSFSLVLFDPDEDRLILFTRDREKQQGYKLLVPFAAIEAQNRYRFPFTDQSVKVKPAAIHFKEVKTR